MENETKGDHIQLDNLVKNMPIETGSLKSEKNNIGKDVPCEILEKNIINYMQRIKLDKTNERVARMEEADIIEKRCHTARRNIATLLDLHQCAINLDSNIEKEIHKNIEIMKISYT